MFASVTIFSMLPILAAISAVPAPVTVALCPARAADTAAFYQRDYFSADGTVQSLLIGRPPSTPSSCPQTELDIKGGVLWAGKAVPDAFINPPDQVGLQGLFDTDPITVSEIVMIADEPAEQEAPQQPQSVATTQPLPLNQSVLSQFIPRPFGIEERVSAPETNQLMCEAGSDIGGAYFYSARPWSSGSDLQLEIRASGQGRFGIALGDAQRDLSQSPLPLGEIELTGSGTQVFRFDLPDNDLAWTSLTVVCPQTQGRLTMASLVLRSSPAVDDNINAGVETVDADHQISRRYQRGAWLWDPDLWQNDPDVIWQAQAQQRLTEIYISVPVNEHGRVAESDRLVQFVINASAKSLDVWLVAGDPHDVLPDNQTVLENSVRAALLYNNDAPEGARLAGVQLDIEPYLLPGFAQAQGHWRERYVAVIQRVHQMLNGQLALDLVMPAWWGNHPAWGQALLTQLPTTNTSISIMNYFTSPQRLLISAEPFLSWGQHSAVPIKIGVESGSLRDEYQRRYRAHDHTGRLWLISVGEQPVFVLFDQPQSNLNGQAYAYAFEYELPASLYTFAGDMTRLNTVLDELTNEWRTWSSFAGISIHGLDDRNFIEGSQ